MNVILEGIVGSKAYGMDTPDSDEDHLGVFMAPIADLVGLGWTSSKETVVQKDPDTTHHEIGKFCRLALKGNPTITELLWLPNHTVRSFIGRDLINLRESFLSTKCVRDAYAGYAAQQMSKLVNRGDSFSSDTKNRTAKHARHCFRLLFQGMQLLQTGLLDVRLDEETRDFCFAMGEMATKDVDQLVKTWEHVDQCFSKTADVSVLPEKPDHERVNNFLVRARMKQG